MVEDHLESNFDQHELCVVHPHCSALSGFWVELSQCLNVRFGLSQFPIGVGECTHVLYVNNTLY